MAEHSISEEWRPVAGFEGKYEVSDQGRVKSLARQVRYRGFVPTRVLKQFLVSGYPTVNLGNRTRIMHAHRLVARAFIGAPPSKTHEVNHKDCDKTNNAVQNLEYVTRLENMRHASINGKMPRGSKHHQSKLTEKQVLEIREQFCHGGTKASLARKYNISATQVRHIVTGSQWQHIKGPLTFRQR